MGGMAETAACIQLTKITRLHPFGLPFTKVNQVFNEVLEAGLLHGCRRLHFIGRL
jgi:hypothetical protein